MPTRRSVMATGGALAVITLLGECSLVNSSGSGRAHPDYTDWLPGQGSNPGLSVEVRQYEKLSTFDDIPSEYVMPESYGVEIEGLERTVFESGQGLLLHGSFSGDAIRAKVRDESDSALESRGAHNGFEIYAEGGGEENLLARDEAALMGDEDVIKEMTDAKHGGLPRAVNRCDTLARLTAELGTGDWVEAHHDITGYGPEPSDAPEAAGIRLDVSESMTEVTAVGVYDPEPPENPPQFGERLVELFGGTDSASSLDGNVLRGTCSVPTTDLEFHSAYELA